MARTDNKYDIIFNTRHKSLKEKDEVWRLIHNSYVGGTQFLNGEYLLKYPKESTKSFNVRRERAIYFNQVSPIVDMLSGLLFLNEPTRTTPKDLKYLYEDISYGKKINEFMRMVAAYSFMFTIGVLVDTPSFDPEVVVTEADRQDRKINPYVTVYLPFKIRDFNINIEDGQLDWVLLDDSYSEHSNPFVPSRDITKLTLLTRTTRQTFERDSKIGPVMASSVITHDLGFVPFRFVSWRDDNNDFIGETVCEDIAMISKLIYNNMSYMDEMLAAGTFKMLAYPSADGKVPDGLINGGVGALSIMPYDMQSSSVPSFIGHELKDIDPFIKAIEFYMAEVLKKVGLSTDETKEFVKSGAAKRIDFQKMRALLVSGASMMGKLEEWIFATVARLDGKKADGIKIEYTSMFDDEDLRTEVSMLTELLVHPIKRLRQEVLGLLVKKLLGNDLKPEVLEDIYKEIESGITENPLEGKSTGARIDFNAMADDIKNNDDSKNIEGEMQ